MSNLLKTLLVKWGGMYNEIEYWNRRKHPNYRPLKGRPPLGKYIRYIKKHLCDCRCILDFGPGVGRTFSLYRHLTHIDCFDITDKHLSTLKNEASRYDFKLDFTLGCEIGVTPYTDKKFDVAIVCQVLLHQRPVNINKIMTEILRVSDKVVVVSGHSKSKSWPLNENSYCFNHNYIELCKENGWSMSDINYDSKHIYFVYTEE